MPELPEVETVRRGLERWSRGSTITKLETLHPRATNPRSIAPLKDAKNATIVELGRRGKYLWFQLDRPFAIVAHLGMSGQFRVHESKSASEKHLRARIHLFDPTQDLTRELRFIDQRTFGWLALSEMRDEVPELVNSIAPDIFDPHFDRTLISKKIRSKAGEIKRLLLDQSLMSGVGNIYADEALWWAKIHPKRTGNHISAAELRKLLSSVESVMSKALVEGGTSFDSLYTNVNGESGYFEHSLEAYGRTGEPCSRCGTPIERIVIAARSSHFCPRCQRL